MPGSVPSTLGRSGDRQLSGARSAANQPLRPQVLAALGQADVVQPAPPLAGEQELTGRGEVGDAVHDRFRIAPEPLARGPGIHDAGHLAAGQVDGRHIWPREDVCPDPARVPGKIIQTVQPGPGQPHPDDVNRLQRLRVSPDQLAAPVAGYDMIVGQADAPAFAVVPNGVKQLERPRIPAERNALLPSQLPEPVAGQADAFGEQLGGQRGALLGIAGTELITDQRGLPVQAGALPDRVPAHDNALGEAAPRMPMPPEYLELIVAQTATSILASPLD